MDQFKNKNVQVPNQCVAVLSRPEPRTIGPSKTLYSDEESSLQDDKE